MSMKYPKFKLFVQCNTFNHSRFITETLNGFVIQKTDFPYICCIVDDASTDGEQNVIRKFVEENFDLKDDSTHFDKETDYAFITYAKHRSNSNCYFAVLYLKYNHYSISKSIMPYLEEWRECCTYEAPCEGDDYWTHPEKLQKAVDFLESNSKCSVWCHRFRIFHEERNSLMNDDKAYLFDGNKGGFSFSSGFKHFMTQNLCVVYRICDLDEFWAFPGMKTDAVRGHFLLKKGDGYCHNEYMAVYRLNANSVWSEISVKNKVLWNYKMYKQLYDYELDKESRRAYFSQYASAVLATKGTIIFKERFDFLKNLCLPYYLWVKFYRLLKRIFGYRRTSIR